MVPPMTLGDRKRMEHLPEIWEDYWSSVRWEPLKLFVLLTTNSPSYIDIHFEYAIELAAIYLWAGQLAQH